MNSKLFDFDPVTGVKKMWHYDADKDEAIIENIVDATEIIEQNKVAFNQMDEKANWKGDMHHVAQIPMALYYDLKAQGIVDDPKRMKAWLNDSDNRFFRTRPGTV
jgi:hypothetical protein